MTSVADRPFETIRYEVSDGVALITLNRPAQLNAIGLGMNDEILAAFDLVDSDDDVRAVVVTGAGRAFCAGADLSSGADAFDFARRSPTPVDRASFRDGAGRIALRIFDSLKPVIGAINGAAVGQGATMILPMDVRLASESARFGYVFTRRGMVPEGASGWFLPRVVGIGRAMEWVCTGRLIGAREAAEAGLVSAVHPDDELLPAALRIAREIVEHTSAVSVTLARHLMWRGLTAQHPMEIHKIDSVATLHRGQSGDAREGALSFLEKRLPRFERQLNEGLPDFFPWWQQRPFPVGDPPSSKE